MGGMHSPLRFRSSGSIPHPAVQHLHRRIPLDLGRPTQPDLGHATNAKKADNLIRGARIVDIGDLVRSFLLNLLLGSLEGIKVDERKTKPRWVAETGLHSTLVIRPPTSVARARRTSDRVAIVLTLRPLW